MRKSLQEKAKEIVGSIGFMEEREHKDFDKLMGEIVKLTDYGYLVDPKKLKKLQEKDSNADPKDAEYVVFTVEEDDKAFFFGGFLLTKAMKEFDRDGYHDEIIENGLPVRMIKEKKKTDSTQTIVKVEFFPEVSTEK